MNTPGINFLDRLDPEQNYFEDLEHVCDTRSEYISIENFNESLSENVGKLSIVNHNIRSLNANLDNFLASFDAAAFPDCLVFTETWCTDWDSPHINGYNAFHTRRNSGRSGGVSIFIKNSYPAHMIDGLSFANSAIEICSVEIKSSSESFLLCGIYRPHGDTVDNFCSSVEGILNDSALNRKTSIFLGDFNINGLSNNLDNLNFSNLMNSHHYFPVISKPTHIPNVQSHNPTLLDQIWLNKVVSYSSGIVMNDLTDHLPSFILLPYSSPSLPQNKIKITFRDVSERNKLKLENFLVAFDWSSLKCDDINSYVEKFTEKLNYFYCKSFPLKTKFISPHKSSNPWFNSYTRKLIGAKSKYFQLWKLGLVSLSALKTFNNKVRSMLNKVKNDYYTHIFEINRSNLRKTWSLIKSFMGSNVSKDRMINILQNGSLISSEESLSNLFNDYFSNIATDLNDNLQPSTQNPYMYVKNKPSASLFFYKVTERECANIIDQLKNSNQGINNFPVQFFKKYKNLFLSTICNLINLSFSSGTFPDLLKVATVLPIFKKGDSLLLKNYRPISILAFLGKIFEKCMLVRVNDFISKFSIISPAQYGFCKGKSTQDAVLYLTELIYQAFNDKTVNLNIFIDLRKAFDTINHDILLGKLELYGIRGLPLKLFKNYLSNRVQRVRINNAVSDPRTVSMGLPQGGLLSPVLFLLFINDLPNISDNFKAILFADDTTLNFTGEPDDINQFCLADLHKFYTWTLANRLSLNTEKTFFISHNFKNINSSSFSLTLNGQELCGEESGEFLGVHIDKTLKFNLHIDKISNKISKSVGIIFKLRQFLSMENRVQLYYTLIYPYLNYCNLVWGGTYQTHLIRLVLLQKKAIRIVCNKPYIYPTNELFYNNRILKVPDIHLYNVGIYMFKKIGNGEFSTSNYPTRSVNSLIPQFQRLTSTQRSIFYTGPKIWNAIPVDIKNSPSILSFKRNYKSYLISRYSPNFNI